MRKQPTQKKLLTAFGRLLAPCARVARITAYATFVLTVLGVFAARSAHADLREIGLGAGHELAKLGDLTSGAYRIHLNGAIMSRASAHTAQSTTTVLDRYEAMCRENPGALGRALADIPSALADRSDVPKDSPLRASVIREDGDGRGMVACFVDAEGAPHTSLVQRLREMSETGDLSKLGRFRYVYAEPSRAGGTRVVTLWADSPLVVGQMFPAAGDAPGTDSQIVPRPPGGRRTLSAYVEQYPAAVRIYESHASRAAIERAYDEALGAAGFTKVRSPELAKNGAAYLRSDNAQVIVSFVEKDDVTTTTIVEDGAKP